MEGSQSTYRGFSPCVPGTDKFPIALKALTCSPHIRDLNAFGSSWRTLQRFGRIIFSLSGQVAAASKCIESSVAFFFQALYWITLSIKSSYFYAEPLPWPVFRNLYVYTEKILLCSKGASVAVLWNFVEKKENLILLVLVLLFWGLVYFLVVLGVSFGIQTGDITSVRASQASQHHTEPTLQIMWGTEMENNKMKLWVTAEPKDRRQASLVPSALSLPLENMTVPCDLGERSTSFAFSSSNLGGRQRC